MPIHEILIETSILAEFDEGADLQSAIKQSQSHLALGHLTEGCRQTHSRVTSIQRLDAQDPRTTPLAGHSDGSCQDRSSDNFLATARIHFEVAAATKSYAETLAKTKLREFVELDDLVGAGEFNVVTPLAWLAWRATATIKFRAQGTDILDARAFATQRVNDLAAADPDINGATLIAIEDDLG